MRGYLIIFKDFESVNNKYAFIENKSMFDLYKKTLKERKIKFSFQKVVIIKGDVL